MKGCPICRRHHDASVACALTESSTGEIQQISADLVNGYRLVTLLESGQTGELYRGTESASGRSCLIRILPTNDSDSERLLAEAKLAGGIFHPSIAGLYEAGRLDDGRCFLVCEEPDGRSVRDVLDKFGAQELLGALEIVRQTAEALHAFHVGGLIHGAVTPSSIILSGSPGGGTTVYLQHPDLAAIRQRAIISNRFLIDNELDSLRYFSPEQCDGEYPSVPSDVYSLGLVFYEMIAGVPPFNASTGVALIHQHKNQPPPDIRIDNFNLRMLVTHALTEALQKQPRLRQSSANTLARQLRHIEQLATHSSTPPPAGTVSEVQPAAITPVLPSGTTIRKIQPDEIPPDLPVTVAPPKARRRKVSAPPAPAKVEVSTRELEGTAPLEIADTGVGEVIRHEVLPEVKHVAPAIDNVLESSLTAEPAEKITTKAEPAYTEPQPASRPSPLKALKKKLHAVTALFAAGEVQAVVPGLRQGKRVGVDDAIPSPRSIVEQTLSTADVGPVVRIPKKIEWTQPDDDLPSMDDVEAALAGELQVAATPIPEIEPGHDMTAAPVVELLEPEATVIDIEPVSPVDAIIVAAPSEPEVSPVLAAMIERDPTPAEAEVIPLVTALIEHDGNITDPEVIPVVCAMMEAEAIEPEVSPLVTAMIEREATPVEPEVIPVVSAPMEAATAEPASSPVVAAMIEREATPVEPEVIPVVSAAMEAAPAEPALSPVVAAMIEAAPATPEETPIAAAMIEDEAATPEPEVIPVVATNEGEATTTEPQVIQVEDNSKLNFVYFDAPEPAPEALRVEPEGPSAEILNLVPAPARRAIRNVRFRRAESRRKSAKRKSTLNIVYVEAPMPEPAVATVEPAPPATEVLNVEAAPHTHDIQTESKILHAEPAPTEVEDHTSSVMDIPEVPEHDLPLEASIAEPESAPALALEPEFEILKQRTRTTAPVIKPGRRLPTRIELVDADDDIPSIIDTAEVVARDTGVPSSIQPPSSAIEPAAASFTELATAGPTEPEPQLIHVEGPASQPEFDASDVLPEELPAEIPASTRPVASVVPKRHKKSSHRRPAIVIKPVSADEEITIVRARPKPIRIPVNPQTRPSNPQPAIQRRSPVPQEIAFVPTLLGGGGGDVEPVRFTREQSGSMFSSYYVEPSRPISRYRSHLIGGGLIAVLALVLFGNDSLMRYIQVWSSADSMRADATRRNETKGLPSTTTTTKPFDYKPSVENPVVEKPATEKTLVEKASVDRSDRPASKTRARGSAETATPIPTESLMKVMIPIPSRVKPAFPAPDRQKPASYTTAPKRSGDGRAVTPSGVSTRPRIVREPKP